MSELESGGISFQGLQSKIPTGKIVDELVSAARTPIKQMEKQSFLTESHRISYDAVLTAMRDLQAAASSMNMAGKLQRLAATVTDPEVLEASSGQQAQGGSHTLVVQQLAEGQRTYSNSVATKDGKGLFGKGFLAISSGEIAKKIKVDENTTLESLQKELQFSGLNLHVALINEGDSYRLSLQSRQTGEKNGFTVEEHGTTLGLADPNNTRQKASDSLVLLDGLTQVHRPTNVINDLVEGVTFRLKKVDSRPHVVTLAAVSDGIKDSVKKLVDTYNNAVTVIQTVVTPKKLTREESAQSGGKAQTYDKRNMPGDFTLTNLLRKLQQVVSGTVSSSDANFKSFKMIGISTSAEGTLKIDEAKLNAVISDHPESVSKLVASAAGLGTGVAEKIDKLAFDMTKLDGPLRGSMKRMSETMVRLASNIERKEKSLKFYAAGLKAQFTALESKMSKLNAQSQQLFAINAPSTSSGQNA
jgi:flagellar hook-associated protein 2